MIYLFDKNPESEFKSLLQYLTSEITTDFLELEKNLLAFEMPPIQKQYPTRWKRDLFLNLKKLNTPTIPLSLHLRKLAAAAAKRFL